LCVSPASGPSIQHFYDTGKVDLGESESDRLLAQAALASVPDKTAKLLVALGDGRQEIRVAAAEWLGKLGDPCAIDPLKEALRKEKQEAVRGAMLVALEALGADVSEFLNRDALAGEAAATAVAMLVRACRLGLHRQVARVVPLIDVHIAEDPAFPSVVHGLSQLELLGHAREPLEATHLTGYRG
jgi:HEAT repeat protein